MTPTRKDFIDTYRKMVIATWPWATTEPTKVEKYMNAVTETINTSRTMWAWDSDLGLKTWRIIHGGRPSGRYTLKALRALPEA